VLLLTLRGTPFLYQGEELGLLDGVIPPARQVDPGGRDGCRTPLPWDGSPDHGWPTNEGVRTWLPFPPESDVRNRRDLEADPTSILHLYRRLLALRHRSTAFTLGGFTPLDLGGGVLGYRRHTADESWAVAINFTGDAVEPVGPDATGLVGRPVVLSTDTALEGGPFGGTLPADGAVVVALDQLPDA
jgi:alpha-glucosidase